MNKYVTTPEYLENELELIQDLLESWRDENGALTSKAVRAIIACECVLARINWDK